MERGVRCAGRGHRADGERIGSDPEQGQPVFPAGSEPGGTVGHHDPRRLVLHRETVGQGGGAGHRDSRDHTDDRQHCQQLEDRRPASHGCKVGAGVPAGVIVLRRAVLYSCSYQLQPSVRLPHFPPPASRFPLAACQLPVACCLYISPVYHRSSPCSGSYWLSWSSWPSGSWAPITRSSPSRTRWSMPGSRSTSSSSAATT